MMNKPMVEIQAAAKKFGSLGQAHLKSEPEPGLSEMTEYPARLSLDWYGTTDTGKMRIRNEDNYSVLVFAERTLFVVADGMGGHDSGEVASRIATDAVCKTVQEEHEQGGDLLALVERAAQQANDEVRREAMLTGSNMGTTLCVALVTEDAAYLANVGDSRAYWAEAGSLSQITTDHSLVAKLVGAGRISKEEARTHPKANLLFRTMGTDEKIIVDTFRVPLKKGGALLLCTDGLWGEVPDDDIHTVFTTERDAKTIGDRLVELANERGGKDNITAIVVKVL